MKILGIDPGLALTGWCVLEKTPLKLVSYGCLKTSQKQKTEERLLQIFKDCQKIIKKYKPQIVVLEKLFFNTNAKTAFMVGEARGVIKICSLLNQIPLAEFTPLQVKNSIVGYGRADKNQIQQMVKVLLNLKKIPRPDDAADAIAVALTYCSFNKKLSK
jgi:crossover junction endodeoxyribonuclease RuvC